MTENKEEGFQLDIGEMLRELWRNILVVILVAVLGGAAAFAWTFFFVDPQYSATATLYVNKSSFSLGGASFSISSGLSTDSLVNLYMQIISSRTTLEEVSDEAGLDIPSDDLKKMISTSSSGSGSLAITVTCSDPVQAELIANTIAKLLPDRIANIIDGSSVRVIDYAIIPSSRSSPDYVISTVTGMLVGIALCAAFIALRFYLAQKSDSAVHSSEELKQLFPDIAVLASIPDMRINNKGGYYYSSYYGNNKYSSYYGNNGKKEKEKEKEGK